MNKKVIAISKREIIVRLKSNVFRFMLASFVILVVVVPWILKFKVKQVPNGGTSSILNMSYISIIFLMYGILVSTASLLSYGLVEEKSSSVLELILSSVSPRELLFGKILGIFTISSMEIIILSVLGYISSSISNSQTMSLPFSFLLISILFFIPAVILFSFVIGYLCISVKRVEDLGIIQLPTIIILAICMFSGIFSVVKPHSTFITLSRFTPPLSTFSNPLLLVSRDENLKSALVALSILIVSAFTAAVLSVKGFTKKATS